MNKFSGILGVSLFTCALVISCKHEPVIPEVDCGTPEITVNTVNEDCASVNGSAIITINREGELEYSIDNGVTFQDSTSFLNLSAGEYFLVIRAEDSCTYVDTFTVGNNSGGVDFTFDTVSAGCTADTGQISITPSGGTGGYTYSIDGFNFQNDSIFTNVATGDYTVTVRDSLLCGLSKDVYVPANDVSYADTVQAIVMASCGVTDCHGSSPYIQDYTDYSTLAARKEFVINRVVSGSMPRSPGVITAGQRDLLICWLKDGAPNN